MVRAGHEVCRWAGRQSGRPAAGVRVALAGMALIGGMLGGSAFAQESRPQRVEDWGQRFAALDTKDWRAAFALGQQLTELPADQAYDILQQNWTRLSDVGKQQILKSWFYRSDSPQGPAGLTQRASPRLLDVLHLGMTDASLDVQQWAIGFLKQIAFEDFAEDFSAYQKWHEQNAGRPTLDVMIESCRAWVGRLKGGQEEVLRREGRLLGGLRITFRDVAELRQAATEAGLPAVLEEWISRGVTKGAARTALQPALDALQLAGALKLDEPYLRRVLVPLLDRKYPLEVRAAAIRLLGDEQYAWAADPLIEQLRLSVELDAGEFAVIVPAIAAGLAKVKDPKAIPMMIAVIDADNTRDSIYGIGASGLFPLTGVQFDESHNGVWWRAWWTKNTARFPESVRSQEIPQLKRSAAASRPTARAPTASMPARVPASEPAVDDDVADVPAQDLRIGGDEHKRYFLIGPMAGGAAPAEGYRLLVVLPGGDGSADFHPFIKRICKSALPAGYIVVQAVAPRWREDERRIVWPTRGVTDEKMEFPTEEFVEAAIAEVKGRQKIDPRYVFALGWSSGGPPVYAAAMQEKTALTGGFVAMSVYRPEGLPPAANAKGRAFYILHSPQDFIQMRFPESARDSLKAGGAAVELQTYEGGHGWHGDVFGNIRTGIEWLEKQQAR